MYKHWGSKEKKKGHLCVFSCVSAARRCVWTSSRRTSSCKQKVAPLNASAGALAGATSFRILSHSLRCGRCAASFSPCWILWETQVWRELWSWHVCFLCRPVQSEKIQRAHSPPTRLFTVGASTGHSAQPLALLPQLILLVHHPDAKVGQIARVQGGVGAQLPVSRVRLFLYLDVCN